MTKFMFDWPYSAEILNGPADVSPDGVYNFDIKPPHNTAAYVLVAICLALTSIAAFLRAYSRIRVNKKAHLEDYLALFCIIPYVAFVWSLIKYIQEGGLYVHQWNIRVGNMFDLAVYLFVFTMVDSAFMIPSKAAILLEWRRIFVPRGTYNLFYWAVWFLLIVNTLFYTIADVFILLANKPIARNYDLLLPGSSPYDRKAIDIASAGVNLFMDVSIFLLPQPVIWSLKMKEHRKLGLSFMFSIGLLGVGCAAARAWSTVYTEYPWPTIGDTSYTISTMWLLYLAEMTSVNLVMCAPSMPRAFSENTPLGRMLASVKSWASVLSSKSRTAVSKSIGNVSSTRRHRLRDNHGQPMGLAERELMQDIWLDTMKTADGTTLTNSTIMKTVEVEQEDDSKSKSSLDPSHHRQHPWTDV